MKKVYVVKGSEDGTLGIFTTRRAALETAINYITQRHTGKVIFSWFRNGEEKSSTTTARAIFALADCHYVTLEMDTTTTRAEVEVETLSSSAYKYE